MTTYNFETDEFGISDDGIHFLRSGYNYKTLKFSEVKRIKIERGRELNNWWLIFVLGAAVFAIGVYLSVGVIKILMEGDVSPRHAKMILFFLIPIAGGYFLYNSFQTGLILKIDCIRGSKEMFPMRQIIKQGKLKHFESYLSERMGARMEVGL